MQLNRPCLLHATTPCCPCACLPAGAIDAADSRLLRTDSQRSAARSAEAARLEAVLEVAGKCNAAMREEDWELM